MPPERNLTDQDVDAICDGLTQKWKHECRFPDDTRAALHKFAEIFPPGEEGHNRMEALRSIVASLTRFRNACGNAITIGLFAVLFVLVATLVWLFSSGKINLFSVGR